LVVNNTISGQGAVENRGSGSVTLGGNNDYTGGTIISSGTLILGANGTLPQNSPGGVTLNAGGKLDLNDTVAGNVGALTLAGQGNWTLQLNNDSTDGSITFSSIVLGEDASGVLTIFGWEGVAGQHGTGDRILVLTPPSQQVLNIINFHGGNDGAQPHPPGAMDLNGELVPTTTPVPEPANVALLIFGSLFGGIALGRHYLRSRKLVRGFQEDVTSSSLR
jgi:autotransporter-associated beta strand protein